MGDPRIQNFEVLESKFPCVIFKDADKYSTKVDENKEHSEETIEPPFMITKIKRKKMIAEEPMKPIFPQSKAFKPVAKRPTQIMTKMTSKPANNNSKYSKSHVFLFWV